MKFRGPAIVGAVVLLSAIAVGCKWLMRQTELERLAVTCAEDARKKDWPRLETDARIWKRFGPSPQASFWLGMALKEQGLFLDAEPEFASVPVDGPRGIDAAVARLEILFHVRKKPIEAIALARELLERDPKLTSPRRHIIYFAAMTLQRQVLAREVLEAIRYGADLREHYIYLLILEDLSFSDAEAITRAWAEASPDSDELRIAHRTQALRIARLEARDSPTPERLKHYATLRSEFVADFDREAPAAPLLDTRLLLAMDDADVEGAARWLSLVTDESAEDPVFWRYRGWYASQVEDLAQARSAYERALELHPLGAQIRHEYSNLLRRLGQGEEAARMQELASQGTEIIQATRRLSHLQNAPLSLLADLARYARLCGDRNLADGIERRIDAPKP